MSYIAACGKYFEVTSYGIEHERSCPACADAIDKEDEDYEDWEEDWDDDDMEED